MEKVKAACQLMLSASVLVLSVSAFVYTWNHGQPEARALALHDRNMDPSRVYTQSADGQTIYSWAWEDSTWKRKAYNQSR